MGRTTKYKNVYIASKSSIEIRFSYPTKSDRRKERIQLQPTPSNLKKAFHFLVNVNDAIDKGTFDYSVSFPDSPRAQLFKNNNILGNWLEGWRENLPHLKASTRNDYRKIITGQINNEPFGQIAFSNLHWEEIKNWAMSKDVSIKTRNNYMSVLRTALDDAVEDGQIDFNPMIGRKLKQRSVRVKRDRIDPFTWAERTAILRSAEGQFEHMVDFGFWTGMRPSEIISLTWEKVDWINKTIRVDQVMTQYSTEEEEPKTSRSIRDVELHGPALESLLAMKKYTFLEDSFIFRNPNDGKQWKGDSPIRKKWKTLLKRAGVRYRYPYQMRHTYASTALQEGEDLGYISDQLGHIDKSFTLRTYTRFIKGNNIDRGKKLEDAFKNVAKNVAKVTLNNPR